MIKRFLIVQLASNGDCILATTLVNQLRHDYPDCNITWAVSPPCKQAVENNPGINQIVEFEYSHRDYQQYWPAVKKSAERGKLDGLYDEVFYCHIFPDYRERFDGCTRSSMLRAYNKSITVPVIPTIALYDREVESVLKFQQQYTLSKYRHVVLCECAPSSAQSSLNPEIMLQIASAITALRDDVLFIISTHLKLTTNNTRIIDASELSYRENAELSKYCTLLVGCSSGISWLLTTNWAKKIPTVQFLNDPKKKPLNFASMKYDFKYYGLDTSHIIETTAAASQQMTQIVMDSISDFDKAKVNYEENLKPGIKMIRLYMPELVRFTNFTKSIYKCRIFYRNFLQRNKPGLFYNFAFPFFFTEAFFRKMIRIVFTKNE